MKKLFFTALVAVVAVGGALSTKATVYEGQSSTIYDCDGSTTACSQIISENIRINGTSGAFLAPSNFPLDSEFTQP